MPRPAVLPADAPTRDEWVELVRADQHRRWPRGERVLVEAYLAACPKYAGDDDAVLDIVYQEVVLRDELGDGPTAAEYVARFPGYAARIRRQFSVHAEIAKLDADAPTEAPAPPKREPPAPSARPARFAQPPGYDVLGEVGRGRLGVVYKARQLGQDRIVALRMLAAGEPAARPAVASHALMRVKHPNVVQALDVNAGDAAPFVASEYVVGSTLADKIRGRPLPAQQAARLAARIARGVAAAHAAGVVHGDLRPSHVLLQSTSGPAEGPRADEAGVCVLHHSFYVPKVADFGLARRGSALLAEAGPSMGVAAYFAPEQASGGPPKAAGDVHALGAILYEALTGRAPFLAPTAAEVHQALQADTPVLPGRLVPGVPPDLEYVCAKCLAKDPAARYAAAADLAADLENFLAGQSLRPPPDVKARLVASFRRRAKPLAVSLLSLAAVAAFAVLWRRAEGRVGDETARREAAEARLYAVAIARAAAALAAEPPEPAKPWLDQCPEPLRGWDYRYLAGGRDQAIERVKDVLAGGARCFAVSDNGATLATGGDAGRVVLIDAAEGKARPLETGAAAATALAFGPKGERLAVAAGDAPVRVFETASRRVLEEIPAAGVVRALAWGQANDILAIAANRVVLHRPKDRSTFGAASSTELLAFAPDGKSLAAAGAELPPVVWPLDRVGSEPRRPKEQPQHPVLAIGYAPVGSFLATAGGSAPVGESELLIWDAATLELRHRRPLPGPPWRLMAIHPEGRLLATANAEGDIALWDVATGLKLFSLKGPRQAVGLSFADRGRQLYVAPANGRLVCWIAPN